MNDRYRIGAAVLIGGRSTRMGSPKENMVIEGDGRTFLDKICDEIDRHFGDCICGRYMSVRRGQTANRQGYMPVEDEYDDIGPLGGIISVLKAAKRDGLDAMLILACDMIGYTDEEMQKICAAYSGEDILWVRTEDGYIQPLGSIYSVSVLDTATSMAEEGIHRIRVMGDRMKNVGHYDSDCPEAYENINSPDHLKAPLNME